VTKYGLFLALFIFSSILNANALTNYLLNRELLQMLKEDQAVRDPSNVDLNKIIELIPSEEVDRKHVAYLDDRLSVASNRPQLYGTQGGCINAEKWEPKQIKNRHEVDERRKAMGMLPLADYIKKASEFLCVG